MTSGCTSHRPYAPPIDLSQAIMTHHPSRFPLTARPLAMLLIAAAALTACGKGAKPDEAKTGAAAAPSLVLAQEDVLAMGLSEFASGPVITGTIQPERRADLRAEVSAVVLQVLKDNGEAVRKGDLIVRLDDTAIRDSLASAEEAARASAQSFEQAERQLQRQRTLQGQGMTSMQGLEDAEVRRNNAQSDLVAARARVVTARQQLQRTEVRAPFDGVVSDRKVSPGDTAQIGKELVKVIDPRSLRFEGLVTADRMAELKVGQRVFFRVNGYAQSDFEGKVRRIAPAANAATRQVELLVDFAGTQQPGVAGLYAEGRVQTQTASALMVSDGALQREGDQAFVWRVDGGKLARTPVKLGARDDRLGQYVVVSGVKAGDLILRHPGSTLKDGQSLELKRAAAPAATSASVPASAASGQ